jgi:hypothetical protein
MFRSSLVQKVGIAACALVASLTLAESTVRAWRGNAFPYLNLFVADAVLGVRLQPNEESCVRTRGGSVTCLKTNARGFRGADWGALPAVGRVLLLGDSQVMGWGVQQEETAAAQLAVVSGGALHGMGAGVPSWGPLESVAAARELAAAFHPQHTVFVANAANDWEEAPVPNARRTSARDGWASPVLVGAGEPAWFPGRRWLMGRSHLVFMVRELWSHVKRPPTLPADAVLRTLNNARADASAARMMTLVRAAQTAAEPSAFTLALLPMDVQVSRGAWAKYGASPRETAALDARLDALSAEAALSGVTVLDLRAVLVPLGEAAFLPDDPHLSAAGHQAVARALSVALTTTHLAQGVAP